MGTVTNIGWWFSATRLLNAQAVGSATDTSTSEDICILLQYYHRITRLGTIKESMPLKEQCSCHGCGSRICAKSEAEVCGSLSVNISLPHKQDCSALQHVSKCLLWVEQKQLWAIANIMYFGLILPLNLGIYIFCLWLHYNMTWWDGRVVKAYALGIKIRCKHHYLTSLSAYGKPRGFEPHSHH